MTCCVCGNDSNTTSRGMCPKCLAEREREIEDRALAALDRIADALEMIVEYSRNLRVGDKGRGE